MQICPLVSLLHILWPRGPESTVDMQKLRRERTQPGGRGSPTLSARTARTAALKTACTTWETTCTWSPRSRTSSLTSSILNVCGRTTPVSLLSAAVRPEPVFQGERGWFYPQTSLFSVCSQVRSGCMAAGSTGPMKPFILPHANSWRKKSSRATITTKLPSVRFWASASSCS